MRNTAVLIFVCLFSVLTLKAQTTSDVFNYKSNDQFTWLGIDYSHAKMIGEFAQFNSAGEKSADELRDKYFPGWNKLMLDESDKYDIKGIFRRKSVFVDIDEVTEKNSLVDMTDAITYNVPNYSKDDIEGFVKEFKLVGKKGIGIMLITECLNKPGVKGVYHLVAINMATKEVLFTNRLEGAPRGFGIRNYWAGSLYKVISLAKSNFTKWRKQYIID